MESVYQLRVNVLIKLILPLLFLTSSCGLKVVNELNDNLLLGKWEVNKLVCYNKADFTVAKEEYLITSTDAPTLEFKSVDFSYSVSTSQPCISSAYGAYTTDFDGSGRGVVEFVNVNTSVACNLLLNDIRGSGGTVSIPLSLVVLSAKNLNWVRQEQTLELEAFTSFKGSSTSSCLSECECRFEYLKI